MADTPKKRPRKQAFSLHLITVEWSDSPYHEGTRSIYLEYSTKLKQWYIIAPFESKLAAVKGLPTDDKRTVAIKLLRKARDHNKLSFDNLLDPGPFDLKLSDFLHPHVIDQKTDIPIDPPKKTCRYCRHLLRPQNSLEGRARYYRCARGKLPPENRNLACTEDHDPILDYSCRSFQPDFVTFERTVYE